MRNTLTARIARKPLPGSVPSKWFMKILKFVTVLIDVMPPSGNVPLKPFVEIRNELTARITWKPHAGSGLRRI
eukprot:6475459-Amphidinium_carterae.1